MNALLTKCTSPESYDDIYVADSNMLRNFYIIDVGIPVGIGFVCPARTLSAVHLGTGTWVSIMSIQIIVLLSTAAGTLEKCFIVSNK